MKAIGFFIALFFISALSVNSFAATEDVVRAEVERQVLAASPWEGADMEITDIQLANFNPQDAFDEVKVSFPPGMRTIGKVALSVTLMNKGAETRKIWASARITVYKNVVVALNSIRTNRKIGADDVKLVRMELTEASDGAEAVEEVAGMVAKRPISAGTVIKKDYLKKETVVRKGTRVALIFDSQSLRIKSAGVAAQDGHEGAVILARTASGREVTGRVSGPGEITVGF